MFIRYNYSIESVWKVGSELDCTDSLQVRSTLIKRQKKRKKNLFVTLRLVAELTMVENSLILNIRELKVHTSLKYET